MPCRQGIAGPSTANRREVLRRARLPRWVVAWVSPPLHRWSVPQGLRDWRRLPHQTRTRCSPQPDRRGRTLALITCVISSVVCCGPRSSILLTLCLGPPCYAGPLVRDRGGEGGATTCSAGMLHALCHPQGVAG